MPPLIGGMERLSHRLHDNLTRNYDVTLIGPKGTSKCVAKNIRTLEIPKNPILFVILATIIALSITRKEKFNVCIGANGLMAPCCVALQVIYGIPSIILVHGLDLIVKNIVYQAFFLPLIKKSKRIIANSKATRNIALSKGINAEIIRVINPGVDYPPPAKSLNEKPFLDLSNDQKIILFVGRILTRKGLSAFIDNCMPAIVSNCENCILAVVGDSPANAVIKDSKEMNAVRDAISTHKLSEKIKFLGSISDTELSYIYSISNVLIMPLIPTGEDMEGFGMVVLEAASHGVPTVAFNLGGIEDAVEDQRTGTLVEAGNYEKFTASVLSITKNKYSLKADCLSRANDFRWENYFQIVENEINQISLPFLSS